MDQKNRETMMAVFERLQKLANIKYMLMALWDYPSELINNNEELLLQIISIDREKLIAFHDKIKDLKEEKERPEKLAQIERIKTYLANNISNKKD